MNEDATLDAIGCPKTAAEALALWDSDKTVRSPEMGGLGPAYEQAIQIAIFEMVRDLLAANWTHPSEKSNDAFRDITEGTLTRIDKKLGGLSGSMVGAARSVAFHTVSKGWRAAIRELPPERIIGVQRTPPNGNFQVAT